jgi:hypothetical protein
MLCERLRAHYDVHILDAYGVCERYLEAVKSGGVPYEVVLPSARHTYIGHKGNPARRLVKAAYRRVMEEFHPDVQIPLISRAIEEVISGFRKRCACE